MNQPKKETRTKKQIQDIFLSKLEACGNITMAAKAARVDRRLIYRWREADVKFQTAFKMAVQMGIDMLEDELHRRAIHGFEKPVYHGGKLIGKVKDYSDTLLMFLLKAKKPETYKDKVEASRKDGEPTEFEITLKI